MVTNLSVTNAIKTAVQRFRQYWEWRAAGSMPEFRLDFRDVRQPLPERLLPRKGQWHAFGFALGAALAVAVAPTTRSFVRTQWSMVIPILSTIRQITLHTDGSIFGARQSPQNVPFQTMARFLPEDVGAQTAAAMMYPLSSAPLQREYSAKDSKPDIGTDTAERALIQLRTPMNQYRYDPLPRAAFLKEAGGSLLYSPILDVYESQARMPNPPALPRHTQIAPGLYQHWLGKNGMHILSDYDLAARQGEKLVPDNAYFPYMKAYSDLVRQDWRSALSDLDRASHKSRWQDYNGSLLCGMLRLQAGPTGQHISFLQAQTIQYAPFLYNYSYLHTARIFLVLARLEELHGHAQAGIAIRARLMRLAALMRDQADTNIITDAGEAIFLTACDPPTNCRHRSVDRLTSANIAVYQSYLRKQGYGNEAQWVQQQAELFPFAWVRHNGITNGGDAGNPGVDTLAPHHIVMRYWLAGLFLLMEGCALTWIALPVAWLNYRRRFQMHRPRALATSTVWGLCMGLGILLIAISLLIIGLFQALPTAMDLLPLLALCGAGTLAPSVWRSTRSISLTALLTLGLGSALLGVLARQTIGIGILFNQMLGFPLQHARDVPQQIVFAGTGAIGAIVILLLPLLVTLALMAQSIVRRVPISYGVWRGISAALLPTLSLLLLGYAGVSLSTARAETIANNATQQLTDNEWRYTRQLLVLAQHNRSRTKMALAQRIGATLIGDTNSLVHLDPQMPPNYTRR